MGPVYREHAGDGSDPSGLPQRRGWPGRPACSRASCSGLMETAGAFVGRVAAAGHAAGRAAVGAGGHRDHVHRHGLRVPDLRVAGDRGAADAHDPVHLRRPRASCRWACPAA